MDKETAQNFLDKNLKFKRFCKIGLVITFIVLCCGIYLADPLLVMFNAVILIMYAVTINIYNRNIKAWTKILEQQDGKSTQQRVIDKLYGR